MPKLWKKRFRRLLLGTLALPALLQAPARACLSCGCGGSGSAADLGAIGGAASLFSGDNHWLIQSGGSFRQITGSFNELGKWNPTPSDSLLQSYTSVLGVMYFPSPDSSLGLQLPFQGNLLSGASWGSFGSISPSDASASFGGGIGDLQLQGSYKFLEWQSFALAGWSSLTLPTGPVHPANPAFTTGSGLPTLSGGLLGLYRLAPADGFFETEPAWWQRLDGEVFLNLGYAQALGTPPVQASPFFQGQSLLYQLQGNLRFAPGWLAGLGLNGQLGAWSAGPDRLQLASRLKLVPSLQYEITPTQGLRLAVGLDLPVLGANSLTDSSVYLVFYQFLK
ncbi:MAG: hypothetical protein ACAI44_33100 [Candidatus Sericytochromatia bacterium]